MTLCNGCDGCYDSLDVRFTKACDNSCAFCIERCGLSSKVQDIDSMIRSAINSGIKSCLILGGEPFLYPEKLLRFVSAIRSHMDTIYITTSLPYSFISDRETCNKIIELIDGLNVSVHSTKDVENNAVYRAKYNHSRMGILQSIASSKIRVSLTLVKGGIDSEDKLFTALNDLSYMGVKKVKINELQHTPDLYVSFSSIMNTTYKSPYAHGCQTFIGYIAGMEIILKQSCFLVEPSRKASIADFIKVVYKRLFWKPKNKFRVMYEDGSIHNSWKKEVTC